MNTFELRQEQLKLAAKVDLKDNFTKIKTIAGVECRPLGRDLLACVIVCAYPSCEVIEKATYLLPSPLPYQAGFQAYREMPAIIEAYNQLENEPDLILIPGFGINHPRRLGIASHIGLALNNATIGVSENCMFGKTEKGKIILHNEIVGFEITTREHSKPIYVSPGHLVSLGMVLNIIPTTIKYPHKMPEPLHIARKMAKKYRNTPPVSLEIPAAGSL